MPPVTGFGMKRLAALAVIAVVTAAQAQPPPDGGTAAVAVTGPPPDAGTPSPAPPPGPPPNPPAVESAQLQRVESQLAAQTERLDAAVNELQQLRAEAEARRVRDDQRAARVQSQQEAAVSLGAASQQLFNTGDTGVLQSLTQLESVLGPSARANLAAAREALANDDNARASDFIARAALDAQSGR